MLLSIRMAERGGFNANLPASSGAGAGRPAEVMGSKGLGMCPIGTGPAAVLQGQQNRGWVIGETAEKKSVGDLGRSRPDTFRLVVSMTPTLCLNDDVGRNGPSDRYGFHPNRRGTQIDV